MTDKNNWPNDPDYASRWNYWSFLPKQDPGTKPYLNADVLMGASGMSLDKAWALTTGRDDVHIAILDSGYEWDNPDTANKVLLNMGELTGTAKPQNAQGGACTALNGYDCNGDGIFTIADYAQDPRFSPVVTGDKCFQGMDPTKPSTTDRQLGDLNHNCMFDGGDLVLMFSDGKDDDGNGYVDDIAGWDFYHNDNDPYDDTRYGHGTGEANDSSAEAQNSMGGLGTCPHCRFVMLRVGESFITDSNNFAKAVVYATDNGFKVVQEALGTINQTAFSRAAIDYAYSKGVLIDASMADENSRHHNMPATWNHTLPVHTVRFNGDSFHNSSSFLAFDSCTNYGGHAALSVAGTSCASEATGRTAGIAGLVYSAGLSMQPSLQLSAEEVMQVLKQSADDINVPESQIVDPNTGHAPFYESKAGWDQRFNYGRMNAFKAVSMVQSGRIPPEVDVTSPTWYQPIHASRTNGPISVIGTIAATRAKSYDYVVEWAAGVEPDDNQFQPLIAMVTNVPSSTITGGANAPLATFDPRAIDTKHTPDPDSQPMCNRDKSFCWGPNDKTITLRVRVIAHYGGGDQKGEARRTIAITNDKNGEDDDLLPGFPIDLGTSAEGSAKLADIDGDGIRDIVFGATDGTVHVYTMKTGVPAEATGFPVRTALIDGLNAAITDPNVPSYSKAPAYSQGANGIDVGLAHETILGAPAIGDLDGDGHDDIVVSTWDGTIYAWDHTGKLLPNWPIRLPLVPSCSLNPAKPTTGDCMDLYHALSRGTYASPVLADLDKDGKLDVIQAAFDANIYAFKADGTNVPGWPVRVHTSKSSKIDRIMSTPTITDLNGDGILDVVTGSNETVGGGDAAGPVFAIDGRGTLTPNPQPDGPYLKNWPWVRASIHILPVVASGITSSQFAADLDGDGVEEIGVMGNISPPIVVKADPGVQNGILDPPNQVPAGHLDVNTGQPKPGFDPTSVFGKDTPANQPDTMFPALSQPAIGDLDQDGVPDPVMSGASLSVLGSIESGSGTPQYGQYLIAAWSGATGKMLDGMPTQVEDMQFLTMPSIADISGDDYPEVILGSGVYFIHAVDACGNEPQGWPKFTNGWTTSAAAVGDVTGAGSLDVVTTTREGYLFAWKTKGSPTGVVQWESFHHDNQNTGSYAHQLDQGKLRNAPGPPDCSLPAPPPTYDVSGCTCDVTGKSASQSGLILAAIGLALAISRRRQPRA